MARRIRLQPEGQDGTSQARRRLPALDPAHAVIDERGSAELVAFVRELVGRLRSFEPRPDGEGGEPAVQGTWDGFANHPQITVEDVVAYILDPERFIGERRRWLGRPHFALLLAFLELLGHAREQLNGLTRRHLEFYYRDVLHMRPRAPVADRVAVIASLAAGAERARLPAGTALDAGRDRGGKQRIYRTERDLFVTRAEVASLRSVHVDRRFIGIPDIRRDDELTAGQTLEGMLALAIGEPRPGGAIPEWRGQAIDHGFLTGLVAPLAFCRDQLFLEHHELRTLMRLVRRRREADREWDEINRLLGVVAPTEPRNFAKNLVAVVGVLDFKDDGLPEVDDVDDLYAHREEADVAEYIGTRLAKIGYANFAALMPIKLRIDAEWTEINRLLERIGQRRLGLMTWSLDSDDPTAFEINLAKALGRSQATALQPWSPLGPWNTRSIDEYERTLRELETHLALPVERIVRLADFAATLGVEAEAERFDWSEIDRMLATAHREKVHAARRKELATHRTAAGGGVAGLDAVIAVVLGLDHPAAWEQTRPRLADHVGKGQIDLLEHFRRQHTDPSAAQHYEADDALRVLELAWCSVQQWPEPVAIVTEWRNLYAYEDARAVLADPASPRWKTFGAVPAKLGQEPNGPAAISRIGWALSSPVLSLSEGTRTITLTLGFQPKSFDPAELLSGLGLAASAAPRPEELVAALAEALVVEASTAKGWVELPITSATLDDEWQPRSRPGEALPALRLVVVAAPTVDPLAPLAGDGRRWPTLRASLRQIDQNGRRTSRLQPFAPLMLAAVRCSVHVAGLVSLQLQYEDRPLDPAKPFEPFGRQPAVGSRFYMGHPELARARLESLAFDVEWMGLPAEGLAARYRGYTGTLDVVGGASFEVAPSLVERGLAIGLGATVALFQDESGKTQASRTIGIADVPAAIGASRPGFRYEPWPELEPHRDLRATDRFLRWELGPRDFGHSVHAQVAAQKARALTIAIANASVGADADVYRVDPPYTPTIKRLSVTYRTSVDLDPAHPSSSDQLLHVHPFGIASIDPAAPSFMPRYDHAGELYLGLRKVAPPQQLSLLMQLAEGTSEPAREPASISWSYLDGDRWRPLDDGGVLQDSTRGLVNSGIVELALPAVAPSALLPEGLYWLRMAIPRHARSVCDVVDIRAQAVIARFDDQGNALEHYEQPLPAGSIKRLRRPSAELGRLEQPYTSFGGRPAERTESFHTRVSERLRHKNRGQTAWDYERLVLDRFPGIYKVKCLSAVDGSEPGRVDVIVIPDVRAALPSDAFAPKVAANVLADVQAYLAERAPAEAEIRVRNADYVPVLVRLRVRFGRGQDPGFCRQQLQEDLVRFLSPWAYDAEAEPTIGGRMYATSIVDYVDRRSYVDHVAEIKLFRGDGDGDFALVPPFIDYHVATDRPDQVLVAARQHFIEDAPELGAQQDSFTGIDYMRIELDFIVG